MTRLPHLLLALALLVLHVGPAAAQRGVRRMKLPPATEQARILIGEYRFAEALRTLEAAERANARTGQDDSEITTLKAQALLGENMLRATQRVVFIDSLIVQRAHLIEALQLSPASGTVVSPRTLAAALGDAAAKVLGRNYGRAAFVNELRDRIYFARADSAGRLKLHLSTASAGGFAAPTPLSGMGRETDCEDFPYVLSDGTTLYYAAEGEASLGGLDLFVTRYDPASRTYLRAENLGMPFSSPGNDYLLAIDEQAHLGYFATDRRLGSDSVCIYTFIPTDVRENYPAGTPESTLRRAAQIASIAESAQLDPQAATAGRERLEAVRGNALRAVEGGEGATTLRLVITPRSTYTSLSDFRSATARRIAQQYLRMHHERVTLTSRLQDLRLRYHAQPAQRSSLSTEIVDLERRIPALRAQEETLLRNMRQAEGE